jgi:hypothetical protein
MLDLQLLLNPLTPAENPGLDTLDPRFQEIAGLVEAGEFTKASEQTQSLLKEGIVDIRVISYFLYGAFLEQGLIGLPNVLAGLAALLGPNWAAVGPAQKKEKHAENGIGWFLQRLVKKLKAEEEAKSDEWTKWLEQTPSDAVPPILEKIEAVRAAMAVAPSQKLTDSLKALEDWVKGYKTVVDAEAAKLAPPPAAEEAKPEEAPAGAAAPARSAAAGAPGAGDAFVVEGSIHLQELGRKLAAFEQLVKKKEFARASVVYNDVTTIVEHFDPRLFIPKMFGNFYALSMRHLDELLPDLEKKESPGWKAMEQLYRVDVDTFTR